MKKIVTVLGARPQFIKAAVLSRIILDNNIIREVIVHTGQHYDSNMSEVFFEQMKIPSPKYTLKVNSNGHGAMTGTMLEEVEKILKFEKPDAVLVYGDTNSTLSAALAAKKLNFKVIHVESGLRSFNMKMPEEINRILTDRISDILFCPTQRAVENLTNEGFKNFSSKVVLSGDIMKDALSIYSKIAEEKSKISDWLPFKEGFVLATIHRQENTDNKQRLESIFKALDELHEEYKVVLPLHPRTKKMMAHYGIKTQVLSINPLGYLDMLVLLKKTSLVVTDSGGLQKEAYFSKKHCLVVRPQTEWEELVEHGFACLVGDNGASFLHEAKCLIEKKFKGSLSLFGNEAGEIIYRIVSQEI